MFINTTTLPGVTFANGFIFFNCSIQLLLTQLVDVTRFPQWLWNGCCEVTPRFSMMAKFDFHIASLSSMIGCHSANSQSEITLRIRCITSSAMKPLTYAR